MILDGCFFSYGTFDSEYYNLVFAHTNTDYYTSLSGDISSNTIFNKKNKKNYFVGYDYSNSAISFAAEIVTLDATTISVSDRRNIEKALFNKNKYIQLKLDSDDCYSDGSYFNCRLVNPSKIENSDGVIGYGFTIECDSNLSWLPESTFEDTANSFTVAVDTDLNDYVYPKVTIEMGTTGGDLTIINQTDDSSRITKFVGLPANCTVVMNGDINYISGDYYQKFANQNFIRLVDGNNLFSVQGNLKSIKFNWHNQRYII